jgi:hypothetical protein
LIERLEKHIEGHAKRLSRSSQQTRTHAARRVAINRGEIHPMGDAWDEVEGVVGVVDRLQRLGYVVPFGAVSLRPDGVVVFHLASEDAQFADDLAALGFGAQFELDLSPGRHQIHPRQQSRSV